MSEATILKGNKLIANFMHINYENNRNAHESSDSFYEDCELEYHKSYDWLMPVVEKIESLKSPDGQCAGNYFCMILGNGISIELPNKEKDILICSTEQKKLTKIEAVYLGVVKFIKWYNKNEKK
jgi:hypothetical protein